MRQKILSFVLFALGLLLPTLSALAHHSVLAEYDSKHPVTLNGVITRVLWINPHTFWYVDTRDAKGNVKHWQVEGDRKSTRLNSSHRCISYAVFCLKKKNESKV